MNRRGFSLVEILMALAVGASALLVVLGLTNHTVRGAQSDLDRFAQDQMAAQVAEMLAAESLASLRKIAKAGPAGLEPLVTRRLKHLPAAVRASSAELTRTLACAIEENVGGHRGLTRITLSRGAGPGIVQLVRL